MNDNLQLLGRIFGRCTIFGFLLLIVWFALWMIPGDFVCQMHGQMFHLEPQECAKRIYTFIGFTKIMVIVLFFFPWLAIKLELRRK